MPRRRANQKPNYARRGVYVDYLERWAWYETSRGETSPLREIWDEEEREIAELELWAQLDALDPIPTRAFVPAPIPHPHLRLLPCLALALL